MRYGFLAAVIAASVSSAAQPKAVWEQYQSLVCRDDTVSICDRWGSKCPASRGQAVWTFNFASGAFQSARSTSGGKIVAREHRNIDTESGYGTAGTIFLDWELIVTFLPPEKGSVPGLRDEIKAVGQGASGGRPVTRLMTCYPQ